MLMIPLPSILTANLEGWWLDARTRSGGESIEGRELVISSGLARWRATITIPLFERARILAYRGWLAQMDGRANMTMIGPCDCANGNRVAPLIGHIPYFDQVFHTDGAGFSQGGNDPDVVTVAPVGSNSVRIFLAGTQLPLVSGSFIGLGGYLYVVTSVALQPGEEAILTFKPKLRAQVEVGTVVEWCHARAPMRLMSDDSGRFDLSLGRYGTATLDLVEVW